MAIFGFGRKRGATLDVSRGKLRGSALAEAIAAVWEPKRATQADAVRNRGRIIGRDAARMLMASGESGRLTADWPTTPVPADWIVARYQRALVARSREQAANSDTMKAFLRQVRLHVVGSTGLRLHSQVVLPDGTPDAAAREAIETWWDEWGRAENCDVTGQLSWWRMQGLAVETAARDGEFFVREIVGDDAGPMGYALQMLDPARCPVELSRDGLEGGRFIRQGIEFTKYGKPVAYYFQVDDRNGAAAYTYGGNTFERIPAEEIIHGFVPEFVGQKRGLPWASTGLYRAKHVQAGEDAAVVNMRMGASKMGFIEFEDGHGDELEEGDDLEIDAEPGAFPVLPAGAKLNKFDPTYPSGELVPFVKLMDRKFAAGAGVSYHALTQDLTDVNFSSIRQGELDAREGYKERQGWLRDALCDRVFRRALPLALLRGLVRLPGGGRLSAGRTGEYLRAIWQGRRWAWIDPRADVDAATGWKNALLASPSSLIREEGRDPDEVFKEIAADIKAMQAEGIPLEVIAASYGQKQVPQAKPEPKSEKQ